jgi:hypothetical protein
LLEIKQETIRAATQVNLFLDDYQEKTKDEINALALAPIETPPTSSTSSVPEVQQDEDKGPETIRPKTNENFLETPLEGITYEELRTKIFKRKNPEVKEGNPKFLTQEEFDQMAAFPYYNFVFETDTAVKQGIIKNYLLKNPNLN